PVPLRHDHGRRLLGDGLHDLERDPHCAGQSGRWSGLHWADALYHPRAHRTPAHADPATGMSADAGCRIGPGARQTLQITLGQASDRGHKPLNQDFHGARVPGQPQLAMKGVALALADGISTSSVSHIASQIAVGGFLEDYYSTPEAWSVRKSAQRVLAATSAWLYSQTRQSEYRYDSERGYVCTFSALIIKSATA